MIDRNIWQANISFRFRAHMNNWNEKKTMINCIFLFYFISQNAYNCTLRQCLLIELPFSLTLRITLLTFLHTIYPIIWYSNHNGNVYHAHLGAFNAPRSSVNVVIWTFWMHLHEYHSTEALLIRTGILNNIQILYYWHEWAIVVRWLDFNIKRHFMFP